MRWGRGSYQNRKEALIRKEKEARVIIKGTPMRGKKGHLPKKKGDLIDLNRCNYQR